MNFEKVAEGYDVAPVVEQINAHPELWSAYEQRTQNEASPHYGIPDIWVRYRTAAELTSPQAFNEPHFAVFYPAWDLLPALHPIVWDVMARSRAVYLGGILITKIPAGMSVKPHDDRGTWHATHMNRKVYVALQTNIECVNFCGDDALIMKTGEAHSFDNLITHSVENNGLSDRITAIICMRCEGI